MKTLLLIAALMLPLSAMGQDREPPQLPDWVLVLAQLGDLYQQWCEDQGGTYERDDDHQLAPGGQWRCYLELEKPTG